MAMVQTNILLDEVVNFLVALPTLEQIVSFHASEAAQMRVSDLLDRKRNGTITAKALAEMDEIGQLNHFITILKAHAHTALNEKHPR